jgi:hypothetical protein
MPELSLLGKNKAVEILSFPSFDEGREGNGLLEGDKCCEGRRHRRLAALGDRASPADPPVLCKCCFLVISHRHCICVWACLSSFAGIWPTAEIRWSLVLVEGNHKARDTGWHRCGLSGRALCYCLSSLDWIPLPCESHSSFPGGTAGQDNSSTQFFFFLISKDASKLTEQQLILWGTWCLFMRLLRPERLSSCCWIVQKSSGMCVCVSAAPAQWSQSRHSSLQAFSF